jgi:hypothetical protein
VREKRDMSKRINLESNIIFPANWKNENCWYWIGPRNRQHPVFSVRVKDIATKIVVRRLMWENNILDNGESPLNKNDVIHSICESYLCVNPSHLIRYTRTEATDLGYLPQGDKAREMFAKITHCPKGHEYTEENTSYNKGKWATDRTRTYVCRVCKTCNRERAVARKRKKGATRLVKDYEGRGLLTNEVLDMAFRREARTF